MVTSTELVCELLPLVAVRVTLPLAAVDPPLLPPELELELLLEPPPPPQLASPIRRAIASKASANICRLLRLRPMPKNAATPNVDTHQGVIGEPELGARSDAVEDAVIVTVAVASGVTVAGLTEQVTPARAVEQERLTVPLNPLRLRTVMGIVPDVPWVTVRVELKNDTPKSAAAALDQLATKL